MGRYVPPELEGTTSANKITKTRAAGTLRKDGTQTVRFEMPFAVWCHTCNPHAIIGQGVRFNAVKSKIGNYYSTPIYAFRIKHAACGGSLTIQTDPKNTAYVVTEGGKARDYGDAEDKVREGEGGVPILTEAERERRRNDAFAALEGKVEEKAAVKEKTRRIDELYDASGRDWDDPWSANRKLRDSFRRERKVRKREEEATERLKERLGTDIELLPECEEDNTRAKLMSYGQVDGGGEGDAASGRKFFRTPKSRAAFSSGNLASKSATRTTKDSKADALRKKLLSNTRTSMNPFGAASIKRQPP